MIGDLLKLVQNTTQDSASQIQNVLYYEVIQEDPGLSDEVALASQYPFVVVPTWQAAVNEQTRFDCFSVQKVFPLPATQIFLTAQGFDGTRPAGETLPATVAALIRKVASGIGGTGKSGRLYIAGILKDDSLEGRLQTPIKLLLESLANVLDDNLITTGGGDFSPAWAVRSPTTPFPIVGIQRWDFGTVLPRLANQRRRRTPIISFA